MIFNRLEGQIHTHTHSIHGHIDTIIPMQVMLDRDLTIVWKKIPITFIKIK